LLRKVQQRDYEFVVSGCDWGGSDYIPAQHIKISTTVHVVVGVLPTGKLDILHIRRYSGMNDDDIVNDIMRNHSVRNGFAIATTAGEAGGTSLAGAAGAGLAVPTVVVLVRVTAGAPLAFGRVIPFSFFGL
jgi:hypothetical protein